MPFKHSEWYWLRVTGPDGIVVMLGRFNSWGDTFTLPDDGDASWEVAPDGRLHKWRILAWCEAKPPDKGSTQWVEMHTLGGA